MYLKNLTVLGFKSFADKTGLNFQPGVSAIVGPNGCGKSNVSDAIRWVLGEQSAKALRGGEMADVIFNGTDGRKPMGMAEVSLTIGGVDEEHLKAAGVELAYNEVTVTRRVFRDGGSEYFINKTPCRLKDIQQLFMGTGVGRASYSIMAQGNITQILSSKPEDRRMVFEEAAGITKFKVQKKEALRKLEYTDQNLLRVQDLIREVKRQIGSLQRQAGKARRYKTIMDELRHLDTQLARHQFDVLQAEMYERQQLAEKLRAEIESGNETVLRVESEVEQLRQRLSELEQEISQSQRRGLELKSQIDQHNNRIGFNEERLHELESQHGKALSDIAQAEERGRVAEQELASVNDRLAASTAALENHRQWLEKKHQTLHAVEEELRRIQDQSRQTQADAFATAQQLARLRNEINTLDVQKQGNSARLEKLGAERIQLEEERARLEAKLQEFAANVEADKLNAQTRRGTVEERQARLRELQGQIQQAGAQLDSLLHSQSEKKSRLSVLDQLQAEHEGFSAGTVAALKQSQQVLGSLADRIRVPNEYVAAIEAALGHNLQLVLTEQPDTARQILAELHANKRGRASIAPLAMLNGNGYHQNGHSGNGHQHHEPVDGNGAVATPEAAPHSTNGHPVAALSVVEAEPAVKPLVARLLGTTRIVRDLAAATDAWREDHGAYHFVTHSGELLSQHGVFTGGYTNGAGKAPSSILGRKNQIADLQTALAKLQDEVNAASRQKGALQSEHTELQASLQIAQTELRDQEVAIAAREAEFNALQASRRGLGQQIETVAYEIETLTAQADEGARKRSALVEQGQELEFSEQTLQARLAELAAGLESSRQERDAANASLTETKVAHAAEEQLCASYRQQKQPLEGRIAELRQLAEQRRAELGIFATRKTQWTAEIEESRRQIERLQHEREIVNRQTAELLAQKSSQEEEVATREEDLRNRRRQLGDLQQERGSVEIDLAQKQMTVQNLRERIEQKYQLKLDDIRSECITITFADEGASKVQTLTPDEMAAAGVSTDWNAVAEQVTAMQRRLDEMGPVNLVAIEEYEETEQRHQFLTTQCDDLTKAKEQLMEVINRINTQTREMFTETFHKIRDNFRAMFVEIFGGGKADLMLVEDGDVLESGIEIMARPPGKQLQSISLLSGGEQTMTAVALLFSIYQVKPSPFCVLDELDAPLDESNINRFIKILKRFLEHSQFIIITHNKRTIGMADILYGVTMQEQGVSKVVSVKFHKSETETESTSAESEPAAIASTTANSNTDTPIQDISEAEPEADELVMVK
jgi:chromosome segregation protein